MGGVSASVVLLGFGWTLFRDAWLGTYPNVQRVMTAIKASKLKMPQMDGYIKRNQEMEAFKKVLYDPRPRIRTIIVTGPRGSGKSTLVQHCLADKGGGVRVFLDTLSDFSVGEFAENIVQTIGLPYRQSGTNVMGLLSLALQGLRESQEELPIIVVETDNRCTPDQLRSLLILMKHFGADQKLIRPIIVLSSSTSAFGLAISEAELRSHYFHVDDLTDKQRLEYVKSWLSTIIEGNEQEISEFVEDVVPHLGIGNRLIQIETVLSGMSKLNLDNKLDTIQHKLDKVQEHIKSYVEQQVRSYTSSLRRFFKEVKGTCPSKKAVKEAFKLLLDKKSMPLHTFCEVCGVEEERLIEIISKIYPRPFYVDPELRTIHFHAIFQKQINLDILFHSI